MFKYSNHLNTWLVWYSNGRFVLGCQIIRYSNGGLKKPVYGPKCLVFKWSFKSRDFFWQKWNCDLGNIFNHHWLVLGILEKSPKTCRVASLFGTFQLPDFVTTKYLVTWNLASLVHLISSLLIKRPTSMVECTVGSEYQKVCYSNGQKEVGPQMVRYSNGRYSDPHNTSKRSP